MLVLLLKIILFVVLAILIRSALPRYRIDQVLSINWKFYIYILLVFYLWIIILLVWIV